MPVEDLVAAEWDCLQHFQGVRSLLPDGEPLAFPPRRVTPSASIGGSVPKWRVIPIGDRLPLHGKPDMAALGEALHGFVAADRPKADPSWRKALAERLLSTWGVSTLRAEDAIVAADRLWNYLEAEHPGGTWRREWPVIQVSGGQVLSGRLDLVVEEPGSLSIYDHKSFPGGHECWPDEVASHAPQIQAYATALQAATGLPIARIGLHLPIAGVVLDLGW
jgi:ATP-dependent helicase/nuclease subunit A